MKHITRTASAVLFIAAFTLVNESGEPSAVNLICLALCAIIARYADKKGYLND